MELSRADLLSKVPTVALVSVIRSNRDLGGAMWADGRLNQGTALD